MSKHTEGPWQVQHPHDKYNGYEVADATGLNQVCQDITEANAKRIVSCVNALEGLSDDALDGGWNFKSMSKYCKDIESQRDELLEALEKVNAWDDISNLCLDIPVDIRKSMQDAIAKAKGEV